MMLDAMITISCEPKGSLLLSTDDRQVERCHFWNPFTGCFRGMNGCMKRQRPARLSGSFLGSDTARPIESGGLELFEEVARGAGDIHAAGGAALAVLDALHDTRRLRALGAIRALLGVHLLLAVAGLGNLR